MRKIFIANKGRKSEWNDNVLTVGSGLTRGGSIFLTQKKNLNLSNGVFLFNHVQMDGGCIYLLDCHNVIIRYNVFIANFAKWGGAVYLEKCSSVIIENNSFIANRAYRDGGAISLSQCQNILIRNNEFILNHAMRSGTNIDIHSCDSSIKVVDQ